MGCDAALALDPRCRPKLPLRSSTPCSISKSQFKIHSKKENGTSQLEPLPPKHTQQQSSRPNRRRNRHRSRNRKTLPPFVPPLPLSPSLPLPHPCHPSHHLTTPEHGARIIFGDTSHAPGLSLQAELSPSVKFLPCDVTKYRDQLALFKTAEKEFGRVDIVVANAGISIPKDPFAAGFDVEEDFGLAEMYSPLSLLPSFLPSPFVSKSQVRFG